MSCPEIRASALAKLRRVQEPRNYFSETHTGTLLRPEKILCFTRKSQQEVAAESLERHHHHRYVLVVPWQGTGDVLVDKQRFRLKHPHALLIFPFQFHFGFNFNQSAVAWQFITFELGDGTLDVMKLAPMRRLDLSTLRLLTTFIETWNDPERHDELGDWLALVLKGMLRASNASRSAGQLVPLTTSSPLLLKINQRCLSHLHRAFGLKELARDLSISESHLRARFRKETGMSLGQHLRRLRLQKSMSLLLQSDLSITQISERTGFDSIFSFSRSFHRFTGMTASDYRNHVFDLKRARSSRHRKS